MAEHDGSNFDAIASVSHELRAPLHAIVGLSELLIEADLGSSARELAVGIHREGQALQVIIDDLLDLSKINAGEMTLVDEPFSLRALLDEVVTMFTPAAAAKSLPLTLRVDDDLPLAVRGDRHRLRQVLVNLVSNAVKYTAEGSINVAASLPGGGDEHLLHIDVADTGPGIPDAALADLFVPFKQARDRDRIKGTGLGLSIVQQLTELMNGELTLETSPTGSTFTLRVPVRPARRASDHAEALRNLPAAQVLVVDDADVNRMVARSQLQRLGHVPTEASNGADAFALLSTQHFDAVLMDWHMPHQDGLETVRLYLEWANVHAVTPPPIIMMTADVSAGARTTCAAAGTSDFLPKPVSLKDLDMCLRKWLPSIAIADGATMTMPASGSGGAGTDGSVPTGPAIDRSVIDQMVEDLGGADSVSLVIATFVDDASTRRLAVSTYPTHGRAEAQRAAHTLKSTAAMLGAGELSQTCQAIETALASDHAPASTLIDVFTTQLDRALQELSDIAAELTSDQSHSSAVSN